MMERKDIDKISTAPHMQNYTQLYEQKGLKARGAQRSG